MSEREETTDKESPKSDDVAQETASHLSAGSSDDSTGEHSSSDDSPDESPDASLDGKKAKSENGVQTESVKNGASTDPASGKTPDSKVKAKKSKSAATEPPLRVETWKEMFLNAYCTIDRRTLGLSRILLGWLLIGDLFRRTPDWIHMFGDKGVLPTTLILSRPQGNNFSLLHGFSSNWELWVLWAVMLVTYVCVFIGYKTKVAQVLSLLFVTSLNGRVLLIENGGYVVHNLLLLWTMFMPMGDRFSLDALLAEMKRKRELTREDLNDRTDVLETFRMRPFVSLVGLVLLVQLAAIYYFNVVHKYGPAWDIRNGTAVHFVLYVDRMINPAIAMTRTYIPFFVLQQMGRFTIICEGALGFCLLLPMLPRIDWLFTSGGKKSFFPDFSNQKWARRVAIVLMCYAHIGFGSAFVLGPFAWALCVFATLLFSRQDWDETIAVMRRPSRRRTVLFDPTSGAALLFCRVVKRLDRFELLGFDYLDGYTPDESEGNARFDFPNAIMVERADGTQIAGPRALSEIIAALPVGPAFAWIPKVPGISSIVSWGMQRGRWSRFFGLDPKAPVVEENPDVLGVAGLLGIQVVGAVLVLVTLGFPLLKLSPDVALVVRVAFVLGTLWCLYRLIRRPSLKKGLIAFRVGVRELVVAAMFLAAINQALTELWSTKKRWGDLIADINAWGPIKSRGIVVSPQPEAMQQLAHKLRFLQGWFMFSPNPVMDDGTIVADAITVDGRHVDPFWGKPPDFDLIHAKSYGYNQIWSDYFNRMHLAGNRAYRDSMIDYMRLLPERTGNPNDALVSGEVWWTHDMNPKWGTHESYGYGQDLLFSFGKEGGAKDPPPPPTPKKPDGST